ncbi:MAG: hypothetical protein V3W37_03005 [Candidatus Binatia bacterium]
MHAIWKYPFPDPTGGTFNMPGDAQILDVQMQNGTPCIWALVKIDRPKVSRTFCVIGTGHSIEDISRLGYIGTFQMMNGALVWHVFESTT